ncbi:MAG: glycosyltransferase family 9 protein [Vitreoscilla sp.]
MLPLHAARTILVFRALMLGDWLCATPALRALRAGAPGAHIALCGLPWTAQLAQRLPAVDEFIEFPGHSALPERIPEPGALDRFVDTMRGRHFDLALQMHGSGSVVNPLVESLGALATAGFATPGTAAGLDLAVPWSEHGSEIERCLSLTDVLGAPRDGLHIDLPLTALDRGEVARLRAAYGVNRRYAIVHPGSQLLSRRWAPERFAAVADALADAGLAVVLTGSAAEAPLTGAVAALCRRRVVDLAGATASIWALGALVEGAAIVVANDTGISHIAAAVRTRSVIVASGSDVPRWAPLDRRRHRVHWHATPCRPCAHAVCPTAHECAAGVPPESVITTALELLERQPCPTPLAAFAS